jgi:hypothetical protein
MIKRSFLASAALALSMTFGAGTVSAAPVAVDLQLVLAVDVSGSVDSNEFALQRDGYVDAFNNPLIQTAITNGAIGSIAVTYVYWATNAVQSIGWTLIDSAASASAFATAISNVTRPGSIGGLTGIGNAINFSAGLFGQTDADGDLLFTSTRQLIDISGDGTNNTGTAPGTARDAFLNGAPTGTTRAINAVAIQSSSLVDYYEDNVIGGPNSFVLFASDFTTFGAAIQQKLLREIQPEPVSAPATLSLVGLALVGLAVIRRRRSA